MVDSLKKRGENRGGSCEREEKEGGETHGEGETTSGWSGVASGACMNYGNTYSKLVHSE